MTASFALAPSLSYSYLLFSFGCLTSTWLTWRKSGSTRQSTTDHGTNSLMSWNGIGKLRRRRFVLEPRQEHPNWLDFTGYCASLCKRRISRYPECRWKGSCQWSIRISNCKLCFDSLQFGNIHHMPDSEPPAPYNVRSCRHFQCCMHNLFSACPALVVWCYI